jgi:DNA-binding response OmpR family regulator
MMETIAKKCIYVLEDNANIADVIEFLLKEEDYEVEVCKTANTFWQKMEVHQPDMIVLDVILPDANGLDICLKLKRNVRTHNIPVMMMSGNNHLSKVKAKCEADSYINKPFDLNDFLYRVEHLSHQTH